MMDKIPAKLLNGMCELLEAIEYANDTSCNKWEFAVTLRSLQALGCNETALRWLIRKGIALHAHEISTDFGTGRKFCNSGDSIFASDSCFVLSDDGIDYVRAILGRSPHQQRNANHDSSLLSTHSEATSNLPRCPSPDRAYDNGTNGNLCEGNVHSDNGHKPTTGEKVEHVPEWIHCDRTLRFDEQIVKRFKWRAANQEAILSAFEEEGWPRRIDDPLSPLHDQDPKRRLSDTIKGLNKKQINQLIRFRGDGTGEGIIWEATRNDSLITREH